MRLSLRPVPRWFRIPLWSVGFVGLWAFIVILAKAIEWRTGRDLDTCLFHRLTGYPCPTCGTTRGLLAMARGSWKESFGFNPLTMTGAMIGSLAILGRWITAKTVELHMSTREKKIFLCLFLAVLFINWAWLIHHLR